MPPRNRHRYQPIISDTLAEGEDLSDMLKEGGSHIKSMLEEVEFSMQMLAEAAEKTVAESTTAAADDTDADVDQERKAG